LTVCSDGSFQTTQTAESILNFSPETAVTAVDPGLGAVAVAGGLIGGIVIIATQPDDKPSSP
jgi:hypothetical protein